MSRYRGNAEACSCGLTYGRLRTGLTYRDVWDLLRYDGDDRDRWRYKRRGTVLGLWHQIKKDLWTEHVRACAAAERGYCPF